MANSRAPVSQTVIDTIRNQHRAAVDLQSVLRQQALAAEKAIESIRKQALAFSRIRDEIQRTSESLNRQALAHKTFVNHLLEENRRVAEQLRQWVQDQPKRDKEEQEALEKFAEIGWYSDPKMPWGAPMKLVKALSEKNAGEVVEAIREYFRERTDAIEREIEESYPSRKHILCDAFQAHREGKYNLSIPVFLTQADGIWRDKFANSLFIGRDRKNIVYDHASDFQRNIYRPMFELFKTSIALWKSEAERDTSFDELNRHQILHGETVSYGTEQNSLKAISFLSWLCWILNETNGEAS